MTDIAAQVSSLGYWSWLILALILMALETVVPGIHFLWFGVAALVVGIIVAIASAAGMSEALTLPWQFVLYAAIAFLTVFIVKRFAKPEAAKSDEPTLNVRGSQYIGKRFVVEEAIVNGRGKIRVGDTLWAAVGEDAARGTMVEVTGVDGTALVVTTEIEE
ncbi:MAG: NfeD family protein [Hyphomicrobium sp.]|nr:NfeD family protein [Hyphomicrobium sp.]